MSLGHGGGAGGGSGARTGRAATKLVVGGMRRLLLGVERAPETAIHRPATTITALASGHFRKPRALTRGFAVARATSEASEREGAVTPAI